VLDLGSESLRKPLNYSSNASVSTGWLVLSRRFAEWLHRLEEKDGSEIVGE
jgi:hypothetical protein